MLISESEAIFPQVLRELREFAQEFEEVRRELLDDDASPINEEQMKTFVKNILERAALASGSVNLDEFGFGGFLKALLPAGSVLTTIMLVLGVNPFLFVVALGIAVIAIFTGQIDKINQKLKESFTQEYKAQLAQEGGDLSEAG